MTWTRGACLPRIPKPSDVCSQGLGVSALNDDRVMQNFIIIEAQTPVPAHGEDTFNTVEEGQTHVEIKLNEGDEEDLEFVKQIAKGTGPFGRAVPKGYPDQCHDRLQPGRDDRAERL